MIFRINQLHGIKSGAITLAFRKWTRPNVKAGSTMKTAVGVVRIVRVTPVKSIRPAEATRAGFESVEALMKDLSKVKSGSLYRITVTYVSEDPRLELRERTDLGRTELEKLLTKLERLDRTRGPWVLKVLKLIRQYPERRAGDLAELMHMDKLDFKINVRKLKNLGLTISHEIGYSLSPLGSVVLDEWQRR